MSATIQTASVSTAAAARALAWLGEAWAGRDADDAGLAVDALALSRVCRLLCGNAGDMADTVDAAIARAFPVPEWTASNLLTGLIAAVGAVRDGSARAASAEEYLQMLDEVGSVEGANGVLVRMALHGAEPGTGRAVPLDVHLLHGSGEEMRTLLAANEMASAFGMRALDAALPLPILLEGAAIAAFRAYDLPLGMRLLRARGYVGAARSAGIAAGFDFLRLSQCDDGSFGDFDTALAQMAARKDANGPLRLKLPVTLQALWTMAELEDPAFRLVRAAFPSAVLKVRAGERC